MRRRYRLMVERIERAWRKRFAAERHQIQEERDKLYAVMAKHTSVRPRAISENQFGVTLTFDERVMMSFRPGEEDHLIRYWAERTAHMLERQLRQLDFAKFRELRNVQMDHRYERDRWYAR